MLTRDDTWISYPDMVRQFPSLPAAIANEELRAQINNYFRSQLSRRPNDKEVRAAAQATILRYPQLVDHYIAHKEENGDRAESISSARVADTSQVLVAQVRKVLADLGGRTEFYDKPWTSYEESLDRVLLFKSYVEDQDGYRLINRGNGQPFSREEEVQIFFGLIWCKTDFDVNREVNNGRGPVDLKVSFGSGDESLIEFKLASNTSLKRNLEKQVAIYEAANRTHKSVKAIICYTANDQMRVAGILKELGLENEPEHCGDRRAERQ